jgi:hypothetical protein
MIRMYIGLAGFNPYVTTALGFVSGIAFIVLTKKALDQMGDLKIGIYMYYFCIKENQLLIDIQIFVHKYPLV